MMDAPKNTRCERIQRLLPDYVIGRLAVRDGSLVDRHLSECPACAKELRALERTGELLSGVGMETAPDVWDSIRANLTPRESAGRSVRARWWFARHKLQSAVAVVAAAAVMAGLLVTRPQPPSDVDADMYVTNHTSMSWSEPFADKAALGLAASMHETTGAAEEAW